MLKSSVLDKREGLLLERERLFDLKEQDEAELDAKIKVLSKQVEAKQQVLDQVNEAIENQKQALSRAEGDYLSKLAELDSLIEDKTRQGASMGVKIAQLEELLSKLNASRDEVKKDIRERRDYLKQQEITVNETIAEWNAQLNDFKAQANEASGEKGKILKEIVTLDQQKTSLSHEIEDTEEKLASLDEVYLTELEEKKMDLAQLDKQKSERQTELDNLVTQTQALEQGLKTRESEIKLREIAINKKDNDLRQKERFIESRLNMV